MHAYEADSRNAGGGTVFYQSPGVPAPTNHVLWFVADLDGDGVPTAPVEGAILGGDDRLILVDSLDGMLLGEQAGNHQRLNIPVPEECAAASIYVYLWNVSVAQPVGRAGQTFAVRNLGVKPPPALGNADWSVPAPMVADEYRVKPADGDGDGLPDAWEIMYFGATNAVAATGAADPDGDGMSNLAEWLAGTVPTDSASLLRVLALEPVAGEWRLGFTSVTGRVYRVECCEDLKIGDWRPLTSAVVGVEGALEIADPEASDVPQRFYRVRVVGE